MIHSMEVLFAHLQRLAAYFYQKCAPNPKFTPNALDLETIHRRNTAFMFVMVVSLITAIVCLTLDIGQRQAHILCGSFCVFICCASVVAFRFHPQVFNVMYNVLSLVYEVSFIYFGEDGAQIGWILALFFPSFMYVVTGSIAHSLFNTLAQLVLIHTIYQEPMLKGLNQMTPEVYLKSLTRNSQEIILFKVLFTVTIHFAMKDAYQRAYTANRDKEEAERQKIFLMGFSHELRNLLNSLIGNIKLIGLEILPEKAKDFVLNAGVCSELLLHLVNNILDTGKVENGRSRD